MLPWRIVWGLLTSTQRSQLPQIDSHTQDITQDLRSGEAAQHRSASADRGPSGDPELAAWAPGTWMERLIRRWLSNLDPSVEIELVWTLKQLEAHSPLLVWVLLLA